MKSNIVQDMSHQEVIAAIEQNFIGNIRACVQAGQGDVYEEPELTWVFTGTPLKWFNGVIRTSLASSDAGVTIEKVLNFYQFRQQIMTWWVSPLVCPSNLSHRLAAHGLVLSEQEVGMAVNLHNLNEDLSLPHGLVIERVQDERTMREWACTEACGFAADEASTLKLMTNVPPLEHPVGPFYLAWLNGEPVATATLYCAAGVAGIYDVCTVPSARQQGIGSAIVMTLLLDARAMGYPLAVLQATPKGQSIYQRLGFTSYCTFDGYRWEPPK
jgi:GNAT superfamily N-acetyltransferase